MPSIQKKIYSKQKLKISNSHNLLKEQRI